MNVQVLAKPFIKSIKVPTSKSYANRLLILGSLNREDFVLRDINLCDDVVFLVNALKKIGLTIQNLDNDLIVKGHFPNCERSESEAIDLDLGDGGTTVRFLLPLLSLGRKLYRLNLGAQIKRRPLDSLINTLNDCGAHLYWDEDVLCVQGPLQSFPQEIIVDTNKTSQFASALALTFSKFQTKIKISENSAAYKYFELTEELIKKVANGQKEFFLPADYSSLAFPMALAAVNGQVLIENCKSHDHLQADSILLDIFTRAKVPFFFSDKGLQCSQSLELEAFEQDCQNCQDLVPVLAYLASFAKGETNLTGLHNLKHKEVNRIEGIIKILDLFSVPWSFDEQNCSLHIVGGKSCAPFVRWKSLPDHRMIMMVYLFMRSLNGGEIFDAHHVTKSFPSFFDLMNP